MAKLIDADKLREQIAERYPDGFFDDLLREDSYKNVMGLIDEAPDLSPIDSKELDDCIYGRKPEERHCEFCSAWCPTGHSFQRVQGLDEAAEKAGLEYEPIVAGEAIDSNGQCYETDDVNWPSRCGFKNGFKAGANWQKEQLRDLCYQCEKNYDTVFYRGEQHAIKMMKEGAIERTVKEDAGGYPYIDETELYDYEKDEPTAKKGDKVKIIILKDE